ncbi:MAG TPA: hypothetical protein VFB59_01180 [Candidatus Saccharimonadales bacterium]|nr:hypothetical protein [Candidatus Saccharimonadales bacterium]
MIDVTQTWLFAAVYGSGAYGEGAYNTGAATTTASTSGSLLNTGVIIAGSVTVACLVIFATLVVRFYKRKRHINYVRAR